MHNLLLLADARHHTAAVQDHIKALTSSDSKYSWFIENPLTNKIIDSFDLSSFDGIGIHYSLKPWLSYYISPKLYNKLRDYNGIKFVFLQDEYDRSQYNVKVIHELGISIMFTLVREGFYDIAYPEPELKDVKKITVLTGYAPDIKNDETFVPFADRTIDIFYRSRPYPFWLGKLGHERVLIAKGVLERAKKYNLNVDISTEEKDRIYGPEWISTLAATKAVLGTDSGSSIWDPVGEVKMKVQEYLRNKKGADYEEVAENVLAPYEGNYIYSALSPRIFEAASLRVPMILFPGYYSGILEPGKHYILLKEDFSNFGDIVNKLEDVCFLEKITDTAFHDLIDSGRYTGSRLAEVFDSAIFTELSKQPRSSCKKIEQMIQTTKNDNSFRNFCTCSYCEMKFVFQNVISILIDPQTATPQSASTSKLNALWTSLFRYLLYLKARLT